MIATLTGTISAFTTSSVVIDVNGVGYLIHITPRTSAGLVVGNRASLFTQLVVREDSMTLYGFESQQAKEVFELLQSVSGIGPKVALSALSIYDPQELFSAITTENASAIERIPGLGKKGAQRVILELKEKIPAFTQVSSSSHTAIAPWRDQVLMALVGLGFTAKDATARIEIVAQEITDPSSREIAELLRAALAAGAHS